MISANGDVVVAWNVQEANFLRRSWVCVVEDVNTFCPFTNKQEILVVVNLTRILKNFGSFGILDGPIEFIVRTCTQEHSPHR